MLRPQSGDGGSRTRCFLVASEAPCHQSFVPLGFEGSAAGEAPHCPFDKRGDAPLQLGLDYGVTCGDRGCNTVPAVPHDEAVTVARETHRRSDTTLLQPCSVALDLRGVDATCSPSADSYLVEPDEDCRVEIGSCPCSPPCRVAWMSADGWSRTTTARGRGFTGR